MRYILLLMLAAGCLQGEQVKQPELWIEIHDVSPGWKYWRLEQILNVTEKYPNAYSKVVLFVIPNHANTTPLQAYPEYVQKLKSLEGKGYILGDHGYAHPTQKYEFNTSAEEAQRLIARAKNEFEMAGLKFPEYFAPPGWVTSPQVAAYLNSEFEYVFYANFTKTLSGVKPYASHEYTWFIENSTLALEKARKEYSETREVFRLTIHLEAANKEEGLKFLDEFLKWVEVQKSKSLA
jgi:predicted deacetylase